MIRTVPGRAVALAILASLLAGCQATDPFCRSHNAADLTPSSSAYASMSPAARRAAEGRLNEAARRCGWEP